MSRGASRRFADAFKALAEQQRKKRQESVVVGVIASVLANGRYILSGGAEVGVTGRKQYEAGDLVYVLVKNKLPFVILGHSKKRAQGSDITRSVKGGLAEVIILVPGPWEPTDGLFAANSRVSFFYFRDQKQFVELSLPLNLDTLFDFSFESVSLLGWQDFPDSVFAIGIRNGNSFGNYSAVIVCQLNRLHGEAAKTPPTASIKRVINLRNIQADWQDGTTPAGVGFDFYVGDRVIAIGSDEEGFPAILAGRKARFVEVGPETYDAYFDFGLFTDQGTLLWKNYVVGKIITGFHSVGLFAGPVFSIVSWRPGRKRWFWGVHVSSPWTYIHLPPDQPWVSRFQLEDLTLGTLFEYTATNNNTGEYPGPTSVITSQNLVIFIIPWAETGPIFPPGPVLSRRYEWHALFIRDDGSVQHISANHVIVGGPYLSLAANTRIAFPILREIFFGRTTEAVTSANAYALMNSNVATLQEILYNPDFKVPKQSTTGDLLSTNIPTGAIDRLVALYASVGQALTTDEAKAFLINTGVVHLIDNKTAIINAGLRYDNF